VLGFQTAQFPAFYRRDSGHQLAYVVQTAAEAAAIAEAHWSGGAPTSAVLVANPVPPDAEIDQAMHDSVLEAALAQLASDEIHGKDVTPALLAYFHEHTAGQSLRANEALVLANAAVAADIAVALSAGRP
jgi:pseudouridine-5'-phosphate glycosidase